jgi:regulatory protein
MDHTITAISVQKRNPQRVSISLDGEYAFGLARIVAAWLRVGEVLSDEKIAELQSQDSYEVAFQSALRLISFRERSAAEVRRKLAEKGFSEPVVDHTLERLREDNLLDDARFAQAWVENRATFRPRGHRVLALELRQKGVAEEEINQALSEAAGEDTLAYQAAAKVVRRYAGLEREDFRNKLYAYLARRGFNYEAIKQTVNRLWHELHNLDQG